MFGEGSPHVGLLLPADGSGEPDEEGTTPDSGHCLPVLRLRTSWSTYILDSFICAMVYENGSSKSPARFFKG